MRFCFFVAFIFLMTTAEAAIIESINQSALPPRTSSGGVVYYTPASVVSNVGWYYTPSQTFMLDGIYTKFDFASGNPSTVKQLTAIVMTERPAAGGSLLASTTFAANIRGNQDVGGTFEPILFESTKTYFIGLQNISDFAMNVGRWTLNSSNQQVLTSGADRMLGNLYYSSSTDFTYASSRDGFGTASDGTRTAYGAPILAFSGTPIPEPSSLALLGLLSAGAFAIMRRRNRIVTKCGHALVTSYLNGEPSLRSIRNLICAVGVLSLILENQAEAQDYAWARFPAGSQQGGVYNDGQTANFSWEWTPADDFFTGTVSVQRTGAGQYFATNQRHRDAVINSGYSANPSAYASTYANSVGGIQNIYTFSNLGENGSAPNDVSTGARSITNFIFKFDGAKSSPLGTLLCLFDPGAGEGSAYGPFTYDFDAYLDGQPVDTSKWTIRFEDTYSPIINVASHFLWNSNTGELTLNDAQPLFSPNSFPSSLVFLDTGNTTFDELRLTVDGLAFDDMAVGFGANTPAIPEPSSLVLLVMTGIGASVINFRRSQTAG